jgi:hypothetical protein
MSRARIGKGVGGGGRGDYIAAEGALIWQGLNGINGGVTAAVSGEIDGQRLKTTPHCHVGPAVSEREGGLVPVREIKEDGPWAATGAGPKGSPGVLLYLFFFLSSFSFLFSYFLYRFCIFGSNCFKPIL